MSEQPYSVNSSLLTIAEQDEQLTYATDGFRHLGFVLDEVELPDKEIDWFEDRPVGSGREMFSKNEGPVSYEDGSIPVVLYDDYPIYLAFGDRDVDGNPSIKEDNPVLTSTVEATFYGQGDSADFTRRYLGVGVDGFTLSTDSESRLVCDMDVRALSVETDTAPSDEPELPDEEPWLFSDVASNLVMFGEEFARVQDFEFTFSNNISTEQYVEAEQSPEPYEHLYGDVEYDVDLTLTPTNADVYEWCVDTSHGGFNANLEFEKSGEVLELEFVDCDINSTSVPIPDEGTAEQDVSITAETVNVSYVE